jgi:hypothetical protein
MFFCSLFLSVLLARAVAAGPSTYKVNVGKGGLVFEPNVRLCRHLSQVMC